MGNSPKVKAALKQAIKNLKALPPEELRRRIEDGSRDNPITLMFQDHMDAVNHPKHYNTGRIEVIEFLEDQKLGLHLGSVVKYVCRAGRKDPSKRIEDLEKALWYLRRKIELLKAKRDRRAPLRPNDMATGSGVWLAPEHHNCRCAMPTLSVSIAGGGGGGGTGKKRKR